MVHTSNNNGSMCHLFRSLISGHLLVSTQLWLFWTHCCLTSQMAARGIKAASVCFTSHVYQHTYNIQYTHLSFTTKVSRLFLQAAFISPLK